MPAIMVPGTGASLFITHTGMVIAAGDGQLKSGGRSGSMRDREAGPES
jgi:hypothetical protein